MWLSRTEARKMFAELSDRLQQIQMQSKVLDEELYKRMMELSNRLEHLESRPEPSGEETRKVNAELIARLSRIEKRLEHPAGAISDDNIISLFGESGSGKSRINRLIGEKDLMISEFQSKIAGQQDEITRLRQEKDAKKPPELTLKEFMGKMNDSVAKANEASVEKMAESRTPAFIVDDVQVEFKGNLDVKDGNVLVAVPAPGQPSENVSTIKFALRPQPRIKIIDEKTPNK